MSRQARCFLVFIILLIPSAHVAWRAQDMPEFASFHDDGVFYVSAKSLATGNGYRIESLAENAYQTKYPPLYPLYLSIIWRLNPNFPENLRLATLASWLVLVACLVVVFRLYGSDGFSERRRWLLMGLLALNPYVILFGTRLFSEIPFICLLLA